MQNHRFLFLLCAIVSLGSAHFLLAQDNSHTASTSENENNTFSITTDLAAPMMMVRSGEKAEPSQPADEREGTAHQTTAERQRVGGGEHNSANTERGAATTLSEPEATEANINQTLEDDICNNIYTTCLAKVATLSQQALHSSWSNHEKELQEQKEWMIAKEAAQQDVDNAKWRFGIAHDQLQQLPPNHPQYSDQLQKRNLAEAEVDMSAAVLYAITVHDTPRLRSKAEEQLTQAEQKKKLLQQQIEDELNQKALDDITAQQRRALALAEETQNFLHHQQKRAKASFHEAEQVLQEAEKADTAATTIWEQLEKQSHQNHQDHQNHQEHESTPLLQSPWEVALHAAKQSFLTFDRALTSYQRGKQEIATNFPWEERISYIEAKRATWEEKVATANINPPYLPNPHLTELQHILSKKPWKEEGAAFESFQKAAVARALTQKKEGRQIPFQREQLRQELTTWNANIAHQKENIQRWNAYRSFQALSTQATAAKNTLKKLKRKENPSLEETASEIGAPTFTGGKQYYHTKSEASTQTGSSLSTVSSIEAQRLQQIIAEAEKFETLWNRLTEQANTQREHFGGLPFPDYQTCLNTWEEADLAVITQEQQKAEQQETIARKARMEKDWEANKNRWALQKESEQETTDLKNLENSLDYFVRPSQKQEREKVEQEIETKKILLKEKKKTWTEKAAQEPRILAIKARIFSEPSEQTTALERGIKRLEREDKKFIAFEERLSEELLSTKSPEQDNEDPAHAKAVENYPTAIKANKQRLLASYFQSINSERLAIQEWLRKNKNGQQEAQRRYDLLIPQEKAACQRYQQMSEEQAIDAALEDIPEATEAWSGRAQESDAAAKRVETKRKHPNTLHWEGSFEQSPQGLYMIAQADQAALEAFQREQQYLTDVKKTLEQEQTFSKEHSFNKGAVAAQQHAQGTTTSWNMLSMEERRQYNNLLGYQAQKKLEKIETDLEKLFLHATKATTQIKNINEAVFTYYTSTSKQKALERAEEQEVELKRVIRLLSDPTYEKTLDRILQERANIEEETGFLLTLEKCDPKIITQLQQKLLHKTNQASQGLQSNQGNQASEADQAYELPQLHEENSLPLKNSGALIRCCTLFQEELTRQIAIYNQSHIAPLEEEAKQSATAADATRDQANKTQGEAKYPLINQAIAEAERTALLWERVVNAREEALKTIKTSKKTDALYDLETAQNNKAFWDTEVATVKSVKAEHIGVDAQKKAFGIEGKTAAAWDQALALMGDVHLAQEKRVALAQKRVATVAGRFQTNAKRDLEKALSAQADWKDTTRHKSNKADAVAMATWERISFALYKKLDAASQLLPCIKEAVIAYEERIAVLKDHFSKAEERFKIDWKRNLEQAEHKKIFFNLWEKVLEASNFQAKGAFWEEFLNAAKARIQAMGALLEEGIKKGNFNYTNDLERLQYEKALADYNEAWCQALRQGDRAHDAYSKWVENCKVVEKGNPDNKATLQERAWNDVIQAVEVVTIAWKASVNTAKQKLDEAPEDEKPGWRKEIRASKTQQALWEGRRSWWDAEKKEWEAKKAKETHDQNVQDTTSGIDAGTGTATGAVLETTAAAGENVDTTLLAARNQVLELGHTTLAAWEHAFDVQWGKASHAPAHLKLLWLQNRDAAGTKKKEWEQTLQLWKAKQN